MDDKFATAGGSERLSKRLSWRDVIVFIAAVAGVVFMNVGVVRALDLALDALNR